MACITKPVHWINDNIAFNEREITYVGHLSERVTANIVMSTLRLVCEIKGTCANGGGPITNFLTVNRMTGDIPPLSRVGLQTEGTCGKSMPKNSGISTK